MHEEGITCDKQFKNKQTKKKKKKKKIQIYKLKETNLETPPFKVNPYKPLFLIYIGEHGDTHCIDIITHLGRVDSSILTLWIGGCLVSVFYYCIL